MQLRDKPKRNAQNSDTTRLRYGKTASICYVHATRRNRLRGYMTVGSLRICYATTTRRNRLRGYMTVEHLRYAFATNCYAATTSRNRLRATRPLQN